MTVKVRRIEPGVSGGLLSEYEGDPHFMNITESEYMCLCGNGFISKRRTAVWCEDCRKKVKRMGKKELHEYREALKSRA